MNVARAAAPNDLAGRFAGDRWKAATVAVIALGMLCQLALSDFDPFTDEVASVWFAQHPISTLWSDWMVRETNPPLYYSALRGWIALFGQSNLALRSLSVAIATAAVAGVALLAARVAGSWRASFIACALLLVNFGWLANSLQARGYILSAAGAVFACLFAVKLLFDEERQEPQLASRRLLAAAGLTLALVVALYSHTTMVFFMIALNAASVLCIWRQRDVRALVWLVVCDLAVVACFAWWLLITVRQFEEPSIAWMQTLSLPDAVGAVVRQLLPGIGPLVAISGAICVVAAGFALIGSRVGGALWLVALTVGFGIAAMMMADQFKPVLGGKRTLLWALPLLLIIVAAGLDRMSPLFRGAAIVGLVVVSVAQLVRDIPDLQLESTRDAVRHVLARAPDAQVFVPGEAFALYAEYECGSRGRAACGLQIAPVRTWHTPSWPRNAPRQPLIAEATALRCAGRDFYTLDWDFVGASDGFRRSGVFQPKDAANFGRITVTRWTRADDAPRRRLASCS